MKLYNYTGGTTYNVFDIAGGGTLIEVQDEDGISHVCCEYGMAEDTINLMVEGNPGTVCFHHGLYKIDSLSMVE